MNVAIVLVGCLLLHSCLSQQLKATDIPAVLKNRIETAKTAANAQLQLNQNATKYAADVYVETVGRSVQTMQVALDNFIELEKRRLEGLDRLLKQGLGLFMENSANIPSSAIRNAVQDSTTNAIRGVEQVSNTVTDILERLRVLGNNRLAIDNRIAQDIARGASAFESAARTAASTAIDRASGVVGQTIDQSAAQLNSQLTQAAKQATQQLIGGRRVQNLVANGRQAVEQLRRPSTGIVASTTPTVPTIGTASSSTSSTTTTASTTVRRG